MVRKRFAKRNLSGIGRWSVPRRATRHGVSSIRFTSGFRSTYSKSRNILTFRHGIALSLSGVRCRKNYHELNKLVDHRHSAHTPQRRAGADVIRAGARRKVTSMHLRYMRQKRLQHCCLHISAVSHWFYAALLVHRRPRKFSSDVRQLNLQRQSVWPFHKRTCRNHVAAGLKHPVATLARALANHPSAHALASVVRVACGHFILMAA